MYADDSVYGTMSVFSEKVKTDMWQHVKLCQLMWKLLNGLVNEMYLIRKTCLNHILHLIKFNLTTLSPAKDNIFPIQNMLLLQMGGGDIGQEGR